MEETPSSPTAKQLTKAFGEMGRLGLKYEIAVSPEHVYTVKITKGGATIHTSSSSDLGTAIAGAVTAAKEKLQQGGTKQLLH